jgi:DNA-directed RNA polymerase specialized sigma24 family protein
MARLPENRRLAVGLHLRGMTTDEIADLMEWSEPKARNLVYRGLKDLRGELRDMGVEYSG